jgi:hypothetical protein
VHLTPFMAKFPKGELIVTYTLDPDTLTKPVTLSGFQISRDGGEHWGRRYGVLMQHIPMIFVPKPHDSLMAIASELFRKTPGDERNFQGSYYLFEQGGNRMVMSPDGIKVVDWPWPVQGVSGPQPRDMWAARRWPVPIRRSPRPGLMTARVKCPVWSKCLPTNFFSCMTAIPKAAVRAR